MAKQALHALGDFVVQRPNFDLCNYDSMSSYRSDYRPVLQARHDYFLLAHVVDTWLHNDADKFVAFLDNQNSRLQYTGKSWDYSVGQYFPTEYRVAACRLLANFLWQRFRDETREDGTKVYADGHALRKAFKLKFGKRIQELYFN